MVLRRAGYTAILREDRDLTDREVALGKVTIPADNTPIKAVDSILVPTPVWRYKGPEKTIKIFYQVGYLGAIAFDGQTERVDETFIQKRSDDWATFAPDPPLKGVKLTGLKPRPDDIYDMEMWFTAPAMEDQGAIFTGCCQVPAAAPELEIVSCSFA